MSESGCTCKLIISHYLINIILTPCNFITIIILRKLQKISQYESYLVISTAHSFIFIMHTLHTKMFETNIAVAKIIDTSQGEKTEHQMILP